MLKTLIGDEINRHKNVIIELASQFNIDEDLIYVIFNYY